MRCGRSFGWRRRRHHCRLCGRCIRASCSGRVSSINYTFPSWSNFGFLSYCRHFIYFRILMLNKIHHHRRQLNLHELVMPPIIPCFRSSSSSKYDPITFTSSIMVVYAFITTNMYYERSLTSVTRTSPIFDLASFHIHLLGHCNIFSPNAKQIKMLLWTYNYLKVGFFPMTQFQIN